jgi:hypothetical protein
MALRAEAKPHQALVGSLNILHRERDQLAPPEGAGEADHQQSVVALAEQRVGQGLNRLSQLGW